MKILAGIDNDPDAAATYRLNFPNARFYERDIATVSTAEVKSFLPKRGKVLFSGCAPCQPFSKQNRSRGNEDPRRYLLGEFQRFVVELRPDYVVVENVPGLQRVGTEGPFAEFIETLQAMGYDVNCKVLPALHFGIPQMRKRLVLIASRSSFAPMPVPTHGPGLKNPSTVREWIGDLAEIAAGETDPSDPDHTAMKLSEINLKRILATAEGKGRESWTDELLLECHRGHRGHSDVYGRLAWDRPASAMTTRCLSYSNGRYGHPTQARAISVREAACLQTFPRTFQFSGQITSKGRQVGNAVPPLLAKKIAESIIDASKSGVVLTRDSASSPEVLRKTAA